MWVTYLRPIGPSWERQTCPALDRIANNNTQWMPEKKAQTQHQP